MENLKDIKIKKIAYILLFAPFIFPTGLQYNSNFDFFYDKMLFIWRIISSLICIVQYFKSKKGYIDKTAILFFICIITLLFSTIYNKGSLITLFSSWGGMFCFYLRIQAFLRKGNIEFIGIMRNWLFFIMIINLMSMIIYPEGMNLDKLVIKSKDTQYTWIWGFKNTLCNLIIPFLIFTFIYSNINNKRLFSKFNICALTLVLLTAMLSKSSTLILSVIVLIALLLLHNIKIFQKVINPKTATIIMIVITIMIVFLNAQNTFAWLIEGILGKDLTLSSRTILWKYAIEDIVKSPILGYGVQDASSFGLLRYASTFSHCHNAILTLLYQGGIICFITYVLFFINAVFKNYKKGENSNLEYVLSCIIIFQMIFHLTGSIGGIGIPLIIASVQNINLFTKERQKEEK